MVAPPCCPSTGDPPPLRKITNVCVKTCQTLWVSGENGCGTLNHGKHIIESTNVHSTHPNLKSANDVSVLEERTQHALFLKNIQVSWFLVCSDIKITRRLSQIPWASFAMVLASRGAISKTSAQRLSSTCKTGSDIFCHVCCKKNKMFETGK